MTIWLTKTGESIEFKDLTDQHLLNIKKHLEKKEATESSMYFAVKLEVFVRQHASTYPFINELVDLLRDYVHAATSEASYEWDPHQYILEDLNGLGQEW
jgi:enamine deaminase RidA (YjgF/YER057c/UK114 family)